MHTPDSALTSRLSVPGSMEDRFGEILTEKALDFVAGLHSQFAGRRADLLAIRRGRNDQERRPFVRNSRNALAPLRQDQQGLGSLHVA